MSTMQLYRCDSCLSDYVIATGQTIRCVYCSSKERTPKGEITPEDINLLLEERASLLNEIAFNKSVKDKP